MSSGLTLGIARALLPTAALPASRAVSAATAAPYINAATSWLLSHGKWRGAVAAVVFAVNDNVQVTLPRGMLAILGGIIQGVANPRLQYRFPVMNEWYQWLPGGPGLVTHPPYDTQGFEAQGDGFVIYRDLPAAGTIKVYSTATESAGTINIRGFSGGQKVFTNTGPGSSRVEGENVAMPTTANTSVSTVTVWDAGNSLYGVVKPPTNGVVNFNQVGSTETQIGSYEPGEQVPCYRRYLVPQRFNSDGQLVAICKRRHVDVVVDNDPIVPGNITSLEIALMAVDFRRKAETERANEYIKLAIDELNSELAEFEAEQSYGAVQIDPFIGMGGVPNLV